MQLLHAVSSNRP